MPRNPEVGGGSSVDPEKGREEIDKKYKVARNIIKELPRDLQGKARETWAEKYSKLYEKENATRMENISELLEDTYREALEITGEGSGLDFPSLKQWKSNCTGRLEWLDPGKEIDLSDVMGVSAKALGTDAIKAGKVPLRVIVKREETGKQDGYFVSIEKAIE